MTIPQFEERALFDRSNPDGYLESDVDFIGSNFDLCVWLLERWGKAKFAVHHNGRLEGVFLSEKDAEQYILENKAPIESWPGSVTWRMEVVLPVVLHAHLGQQK